MLFIFRWWICILLYFKFIILLKDISFYSYSQIQVEIKFMYVCIEKPHVADVYTANMGGVDWAHQLCSFYFAGFSLRKWYRYIFWFSLTFQFAMGSFLNQLIAATKEKGSAQWLALGLTWQSN